MDRQPTLGRSPVHTQAASGLLMRLHFNLYCSCTTVGRPLWAIAAFWASVKWRTSRPSPLHNRTGDLCRIAHDCPPRAPLQNPRQEILDYRRDKAHVDRLGQELAAIRARVGSEDHQRVRARLFESFVGRSGLGWRLGCLLLVHVEEG